MKRHASLFLIAIFSGVLTLSGYKFFLEETPESSITTKDEAKLIPTNYMAPNFVEGSEIDFTFAAEKTINAVVHIKNRTVTTGPTNIYEFLYGRGQQREIVGSGSGVIITPDGYIVTNNHVIDNASQIEVVLNDNKSYDAELVGTDPKTDIALLKINTETELPYVPFADSNAIKVGEWVLAVGNPFNLTSTVTAGIVSAKARNLNEFDGNPQSFIQTDAAVNRGNSGGALVNINGELVGINTAITSQTGAFIGYSFAVPSNITKKVVEDILEYGNVQRAILGIQILNSNSNEAQELGVNNIQGVYVADIEKGSGADKSGIKKGDIIKHIDQIQINKFSDLSGYLSSKRPNDKVNVLVERNGNEKIIPVTLAKLETYEMQNLGLEVKNLNESELKALGIKSGVIVTRPLTREMAQYNLSGIVITKINDQVVKSIDDVRNIMENQTPNTPIKISFIDQQGETNTFIFR
ncbi:trypsin-like peptidase domain-containing protein [Planktosalinus lacus]|uniref:Serine protease n=1 Tax=Planktosalinus lacus TaxID=1526573 RepID=A0A8J2VAC6_9FLAO|nr:trypsin-like peptidase domain-containing protein [Planktosalinus lacus]GGD90842.1 serine protease [Planktosalinus lacus]